MALSRAEKEAAIFTRYLKTGHFPYNCKVARLMLIRKLGKPLDLPSSYRPLSLINTVAKLFERVVKGRLEALLNSIPIGLSGHQFGFHKGRLTVDAIQKVMSIVQRVGTGLLAARYLCVLVAIDVANALNTAPWHNIGIALIEKGVPGYMIKIIRDYLDNRRLLTDIGEMPISCGVPQGSVIGPCCGTSFMKGSWSFHYPSGLKLLDLLMICRGGYSPHDGSV